MLHFRKMDVEDLQFIYSNDHLRPLVTVAPVGEKFGVLVEDEGAIKGGLTGYIDKQGAMIQMIKIPDGSEHDQLIEGLLRAAVYMLDRENIKIIFYKEKIDDIFSRVGFKESKDRSTLPNLKIGKLIIDDIGKDSFSFLEVEKFFTHTCS